MATRFRLAAFGHTMEVGRVVEWKVSEGDEIKEGDEILSVETDKAVVDVESPLGGVILKIVGQADQELPVGATLAWIGDAGEEVPDEPEEPVALEAEDGFEAAEPDREPEAEPEAAADEAAATRSTRTGR